MTTKIEQKCVWCLLALNATMNALNADIYRMKIDFHLQ